MKNRSGTQDQGNFLFGASAAILDFTDQEAQLGADLHSLGSNGTPEDQDAVIARGLQFGRNECFKK